MKKYFAFFASAALMMAACAKEEVNTPVETPVVGETELITVELNPGTKTLLNGKATVWTKGDMVSVTANGTSLGNLEFNVETSKFSGELSSAALEGTEAVVLNYPAGVTEVPITQAAVANSFANGAALLEGSTTMAALRAGEGARLSNTTALLKFQTPVAGDVAFTIGTTTYTVTGCAANTEYYACVDPVKTGKLSYTVGLALGAKEKDNFSTEVNKVYSLGVLTTLTKSDWAIVGNVVKFGSWTPANSQYWLYESDDFYVAKNVPFAASDEFKFVKGGSTWRSVSAITLGQWSTLIDGGNLKLAAGNYDIYILKNNTYICIVKAGSAVELPDLCRLIVKVNKKYTWWNKYIYAWDTKGTALCGSWPGTVMNYKEEAGNYYVYYYDFPESYNNVNINYHVNGGGDDSKTKDATITLSSASETTVTVD